jgi:ubiquinone biosynthesis protein
MGTLLDRTRLRTGTTARRSREIARILAGHGLESLAGMGGLGRFVPRFRRRAVEEPPLTQAERLRIAFGELGATFIKLGQMLSTRADLLPANFIAELSKLQDAAPPVPFPEVERIVREEMARTGSAPFLMFDPEPIAAASIGQVHAAVLLDGSSVVVKVRRPGVVEQVERDLDILRGIVAWMQVHTPIGRDYELTVLADEFAYTLRNELDYLREAQNAKRLRLAFDGDPGVHIPLVYDEYTTSRMLTLERVGGVKISDLETLDRLEIPRRAVAENAVRICLREVFEFGVFHADPHPGNFFVQPDASLAIVDFGMVGQVNEMTKRHLLRAVQAVSRQDAEDLAEELYALGVAGRRAHRAAFQRDLEHLIGSFAGRTVRDLSAASVTDEIARVAFRHKLQLPPGLALLLRVVNMSEGLGLMLDPEFRYLEYAGPIVSSTWRRETSVAAVATRAGRAAIETAELSLDFPRQAARLLARLDRGEVPVQVSHQGLERFTHEFQQMTNRLALSIILGASVVALGLAVGVRLGPTMAPLVTWLFRLGLLFSLAFGATVLWGIWRSGRR